MPRIALAGAPVLLGILAAATTGHAQTPQPVILNWVWHNEGDPLKSAPEGTRYYRRTFTLERYVDEGTLEVTATGRFTAWVNGTQVGEGEGPGRVYAFDARPLLSGGKNAIALLVHHASTGPAGLLARLAYVPNGQSRTAIVSDETWRSSAKTTPGWQKTDFDDGGWGVARVLGPYGKTGPWKGLTWDSGSDDRFQVPPGFRVEMAARNPKADDPFSLINLTFDARGRLLVSQEKGPILLCTQPNREGVFQSVRPYCRQVTGCQGMCWVRDALLLVGDGPDGVGLYRCRDSKGRDETDDIKLLYKFKGEMGEHGPHAVLHGPDDCVYVVSGNHAWLKVDQLASNSPLTRWPHGTMGPDQGKPGTTEDVLLPRQNDARGHAANILAPGGTIWRLDQDGCRPALVAAGFRNHFDAAFSPRAELFTFDSDMEWDEGLPWYRPVRICHCPPGADFLWRTGASNTPAYYIDSLPPAKETGRGSPVGMEFYDHDAFPSRYRGAYFLGDWSLGLIHVAWLERVGASYEAKVERFCRGNPMNVTDLAVGPDGALYFTMGGRGSPGGVYRILYGKPLHASRSDDVEGLLSQPQALSAWARARVDKSLQHLGREQAVRDLLRVARDTGRSADARIKALNLVQNCGTPPPAELLEGMLHDSDAEVRSHALWLLGVNKYREAADAIRACLRDPDLFVRRRACEAAIRAEVPSTADDLWPLLGNSDRFLRTAARLVLERLDVGTWIARLAQESNDRIALEAIIALCKTGQAGPHTGVIFDRLERVAAGADLQRLLDQLRTLQLALVHTGIRPESVRRLASACAGMFPHRDWRVNRELAILLTAFARERLLSQPIHERLLASLESSRDSRAQQIHYFYCLRLLHEGWSAQQKHSLLAWYDATKDWRGGASFTPYLENILRDFEPAFTAEDRSWVVSQGLALPMAAAGLLRSCPAKDVPAPDALRRLYDHAGSALPKLQADNLRDAIIEAMARAASRGADDALLAIGQKDPGQRDSILRALARHPTDHTWLFLVEGLASTNPVVLFDLIVSLKKSELKPRTDDAPTYRNLLVAATKLDPTNRWKVVELLRHWSGGKQFGADEGDWQPELAAWGRWFGQTFPKQAPLTNVAAEAAAESKYKYDDLLVFLEKDPAGRRGDPIRGRTVFEKAQCLKCHRFGREGEGIGPDLTTVSKRFNRQYMLESILLPSKVISDQYRSTVIVTRKGLRITGLAAPQGELVTVLQSDATKITLKRAEIEERLTSLVSVMPERLLDPLTRQEIADLFAYLESEPSAPKPLDDARKAP